jgi:hypothetical protein
MPAFLVHVGPHKTGTTYLQVRLAAARDRLWAHGVCYPDIWDSAPGEPSHRKLVVALREARAVDLRAQFAEIRRSGPDAVLISAEGIGHLDHAALDLLASLIGADPVTVIFYCRRWSEILPSLWQETVKHGDDDTLPEFLARHLADPIGSPVLNFTHALDRYARVFGRSNVALVSYSNLGDQRLDLAEHFVATFLPQLRPVAADLPAPREPRPNQSLATQDIEIIRALNSFSFRDGLARASRLRDWVWRQRGSLDLSALYSLIDTSMTTMRLSDASAALDLLHKRSSEAWQDRLMQPCLTGLLFEPRTVELRFASSRYLTDAAAQNRLAEIYAAFRVASSAGCSD